MQIIMLVAGGLNKTSKQKEEIKTIFLPPEKA